VELKGDSKKKTAFLLLPRVFLSFSYFSPFPTLPVATSITSHIPVPNRLEWTSSNNEQELRSKARRTDRRVSLPATNLFII